MAGPSCAEALSFFLRKGTFIWEDTSGSLPLGFCGAGWGGGGSGSAWLRVLRALSRGFCSRRQ